MRTCHPQQFLSHVCLRIGSRIVCRFRKAETGHNLTRTRSKLMRAPAMINHFLSPAFPFQQRIERQRQSATNQNALSIYILDTRD
jgi:hypothetical protein